MDWTRILTNVAGELIAPTTAAYAREQAPRLLELDVNPLICAGERIIAVDALIARSQA